MCLRCYSDDIKSENYWYANKHQRKPKRQSRMDNPEKLATLGTQDTGPRQIKLKTQHRKLKR